MFYVTLDGVETKFNIMNEIYKILQKPTTIDKVHESMYRSYNIVDYILKMVERGDSKETIADVAELMNSTEKDIELKK